MISKRYRCAACQRVFQYDHHPSIEADPLPGMCPYDDCGSNAMPDPALVAPHLATKTIVATVDSMHRQMEAGAEFRAQMAMETMGLDSSEAAQIRMTDMLDGRREGESSAPVVRNELTKQIEAAPGTLGFNHQPGAIAQGLQQAVFQGSHVNAGLRAMESLKRVHGRTASQTIAAGTEGPRQMAANPVTVTHTPALETQQPGYRKRA
jgi:hypothetical protein